MTETLSPDGIAALSEELPDWRVEDGRVLVLDRRFPDFDAAFAFVSAVAELARARDHHPDIAFGWGRATVRLFTHDAGGLTARDVQLAGDIAGLCPAPGPIAPARWVPAPPNARRLDP